MKTRSAASNAPLGFALLFFVALCTLKVMSGPIFDWNGRRLVGPIAVARGLNPYTLTETGSGYIAGVNGAMSLLLLTPTSWVSNPNQAIFLGLLIMMLCFFVPAFWVLQQALKDCPAWLRQSAVALFGFLSFHSAALATSSSIVHADAPALGFAALALGMLYRGIRDKSRLSIFWSLTLATLAVNSKVTLLPILGAIPFAVAITLGAREFWRATALSCCLFFGSQILAAAYFGWEAYLHLTWTSLVSFPWVSSLNTAGPPAASFAARIKTTMAVGNEIYQEYWWYLVSLTMALGWKLGERKSWKFSLEKILFEPWALSLWFAAFLLPPSLMGRAKGGGAINTQSPFVYFLVLSFVLLLCELAKRLEVRAGRKAQLATFILVLFAGATHGITTYSLVHFLPTVKTNPHQASYLFAKAHPGEVYFPEFPLSTLLSENQIYHSGVTAAEIESIGIPVSIQTFQKGVPRSLKWVVFYGGAHPFVMERLPGFTKEVRFEELPGWVAYQREGEAADFAISTSATPENGSH